MLQPKALAVVNEVRKAILGKDAVVCKVLMAILARGHILLEDNPGVERIVLCLDNDGPGRAASAAIQKKLSEYEVIDNPPHRGKDYNDQLQLVKGISGRVKTRGGEAR